MTRTFSMGGTAVFDLFEPLGGYVVAMTGDFEGGAFARQVGDARQEDAATHLDLEHFFMRRDGSTIQTRDRSILSAVPGQTRLLAATTYTVVKATGAFEGMTGEFRSWGAIDPQTGQGVLRFWGAIAAQ